jgi:hypothetical protein
MRAATGNLTNAVLSLMQVTKSRGALNDDNADHLRQSLRRLVGPVAAVAVCFLNDWTWLLPIELAALATAMGITRGPNSFLALLVLGRHGDRMRIS